MAVEPAASAEPFPWRTDHATAVRQARQEGKFLLAVRLSADFTSGPADAPQAKLYATVALSGERLQKLLSERFVPALQLVGETRRLRPTDHDKAAAEDFAVAYICLPNERVLHFVPGFVSADEMLAQLTWVEAHYAELAKLPPSEQGLAARQAHLSAAAEQDVAAFRRRFPTRWQDGGLEEGESTVDLPAALVAAREAYVQSLGARLGPTWSRRSGAELAPLMAHGAIAGEMAHLVLAEFPLLPLADLERPVYEMCSLRRFWTRPERRSALAAWWENTQRSGLPTLLIVAEDPFFAEAPEPAAVRNQGSRSPYDLPASAALLPTFGAPLEPDGMPDEERLPRQVVTLDELALLLVDAGLEEVRFSRSQPPRYLVHDARGFRVAQLSGPEATASRLLEVAREVVERGGARLATGGTSDEDE